MSRRQTTTQGVPRMADESISAPATPNCMGTVTGFSDQHGLLVDYPGNQRGPLPAVSLVPLSPKAIANLAASGRAVFLTFDRGLPDRPVILGVVEVPRAALAEPTAVHAESTDQVRLRALVDGREVLLQGTERIELKCGKASITLTKAGKIIIQGEYISSRSRGAHRIRGGSVQIN